MTDPSAEIQTAVYAALREDARLIAWFASTDRKEPAARPRVFDRIPRDQAGRMVGPFPYIHLAGDQVMDDSDQCHDSAETFVDLHVWSRAVGELEAKTLAAHVARILDAEIEIAGHGVTSHRIEKIVGVPNPDGLTTHRVVTVAYVTSPLT